MKLEEVAGLARLLREMSGDDTGLVASVAIFRECPEHGAEVLLSKRKNDPFAGKWALPGGHIEEHETPDEGIRREAHEEIGLNLKNLRLLKPWNPGRPDYGHDTNGITYWTVVGMSAKPRAGSDAAAIKWVPIHRTGHLAFDDEHRIHHAALFAFGAHESIQAIAQLAEDKIDDQLSEILSKRSTTDKGLLIVFEGVDGVGKSTQTEKLTNWLDKRGYPVTDTKWNSSKLLKKTIKKAKDKRLLTPVLYSLVHAADMLIRYEENIFPALDKDEIIVSDRYIYTSYARDAVRGVDTKLLDMVYKNIRHPDIIFYCTAPIRLAFERLLKDKGLPSHYAAGMDIGYSKSKEESTVKYSSAVDAEYKKIFAGMRNVHTLDMARTVDEIFGDVKKALSDRFSIGKYKKD